MSGARHQAVEHHGPAARTGGLNIYTTLDPRAQKATEEAVSEGMDSKSELETALVSIDPRNGHIKAMVGGKNYRENQYNHALAKTRRPAPPLSRLCT